jgi:uncharacterized protein
MRIVLDTNQLVAALARPPELATLLMAWESARFTVVASPALLDEYQRVLAYPEVAKIIYPELLRTLHSHLLADINLVEPAETPRICRDPDDDKVIAAAVYGLADYIVTIDRDLLTKDVIMQLGQVGIGVISGNDVIDLLDQTYLKRYSE